jgi:hypothetical protein
MSADRRPDPRRWRRFLLAVPASALIAASLPTACACPDGTCTTISDTRLLDRTCATQLDGGPACEATGSATFGEGITADSSGFRLGNKGAALVHLAAVEGLRFDGDYDIEILTAADAIDGSEMKSTLSWGTCGSDCPQDPSTFTVQIPHEPTWVKVELNQPPIGSAEVPYDAALMLEGAGIDIVDLRVTARQPLFGGGCN